MTNALKKKNFMLNYFQKQDGKGFTLIELMIVIAIIGILAAIAIPQFIQYRKKGYSSALNSDCSNAYTASVAYTVDNPAAINIALTSLVSAGYSQTVGVTTTTNGLSITAGTITCSGPDMWGVTAAIVIVNGYGKMTLSKSQ